MFYDIIQRKMHKLGYGNKAFDNAVRYDINNVARDMFKHWPTTWDCRTDAPLNRPPHLYTWMEYHYESGVINHPIEGEQLARVPSLSMGAFIEEHESHIIYMVYILADNVQELKGVTYYNPSLSADYDFFVKVDEAYNPTHADLFCGVEKSYRTQQLKMMAPLIMRLTLPIVRAVSLLNVSNSEVEYVEARRKTKKIVRRGQKPKTKSVVVSSSHSTIHVHPMRKQKRYPRSNNPVRRNLPAREIGGRFRDYRENGLFGKDTHKKIYWFGPHIRGNRENGVRTSDYVVHPE